MDHKNEEMPSGGQDENDDKPFYDDFIGFDDYSCIQIFEGRNFAQISQLRGCKSSAKFSSLDYYDTYGSIYASWHTNPELKTTDPWK